MTVRWSRRVLFSAFLLTAVLPVRTQKRTDTEIFHACLKKTLEKAEEDANVIFTGTIRDLYEDLQHPSMMKATVEVKRVMKGNNVINSIPSVDSPRSLPWGRKTVVVDGIGDPDICESFARKYDTRIFLLIKGENGELKLNSSLIRLTLNNIIRADAAVQKKPFYPRPKPPIDPCDSKFCAFGAKCMVDDITNSADCKCIERCETTFAPVCGTDGTTYVNECHLRKASCKTEKRIAVARPVSCDVKDPCQNKVCEFGAECVVSMDGQAARCQCPESCDEFGDHRDSKPVCGTDGKDYVNLCYLKKTACQQLRDIQVKYTGKCDPCDGVECPVPQVCQLDGSREPVCRCPATCVLDFSPVCGSDGKTYSNECQLGVEACKRTGGYDLYVLYHGSCDSKQNPCDDVTCDPREECFVDRTRGAKCMCPPPCPELYRPVCGSDDQTYDNECELHRQSCLNKIEVSLKFVAECGWSGPCNEYTCEYGAICVVKGNRATCECPSCSGEFEPVCGTDNISYNNECKLRVEACEERKEIGVQYEGLCNLCRDVECHHHAICDEGKCVCPAACIEVYAPVCGSDGETYSNECELHVASCKLQMPIEIASQGACDLCRDVKCKFGATCEAGECVCPQLCPLNFDPVCASNGITYSNECEMKSQGCSQSIELEVKYMGECEEELSGSGDICDETTCRFGGVCEYDTEGLRGCVCNFKCDAVRSPVCGSDGRTYGSECLMREESCRQQAAITSVDMDNCEDIDEELCDGNPPLVNKLTGREFDCGSGREICPADSYCHKVGAISRCCREEHAIRSCADTRNGCCPDGKTASPGPNGSGCPNTCKCNPLGAIGATCDPLTHQCTCKPGVGGLRCDRCEPGYWGLPMISEGRSGCTPCGCNLFGSVRDDCEQMTGRCSCVRPGMGLKCDKCADGSDIGANGCDGATSVRSCDTLSCSFGAECREENGIANCVCPTSCGTDTDEVCGTDGQTYGSECQLKQFSCRQQKAVSVLYEGPCRGAGGDTNSRPKKTTRHILDTTRPPIHGILGDMCSENRDCFPPNSICRLSVCVCEEMYVPSRDSTQCEANVCSDNPCKQGARCVPHNVLGYKCLCPLGLGGGLCNEEAPKLTTTITTDFLLTTALDSMYFNDFGEAMSYMVPSFSGQSYLRLNRLRHASRELTIQMEFKSLNQEGILLYAAQKEDGTGDFVSLALKDGFVEFRYNLGSQAAVLRSAEKIHLNEYHKVLATRFKKDGTLLLDDGQEVAGSSPGALTSLNLQTDLFLGFVPQLTPAITSSVGIGVGLVGCIETLKIQGAEFNHEYDLFYPESEDVIGGMGISECGENACSAMPCGNGGSCVVRNTAELYECRCYPGYSGKNCEFMASANPCEKITCEGGGSCSPLNDNEFFCACLTGRHGDKCQHVKVDEITVPEFHGTSYVQIPITRVIGISFEFEIWFRPTQPNGVLLYTAQENSIKGDFVSLNLDNGYLYFRFDLGGGIADIKSENTVSLNSWHKVVIKRENRRGTLAVDGEVEIEGYAKGNLNELNVASEIYLGGYAMEYNPDSGVTSGFQGAIQRVYENGKLVDHILSLASSHKDVSQYIGPPCSHKPCLNDGICVPVLNDFECRCTREFTGNKCEQPMALMDPNLPIKFDGRTVHRYPNRVTIKKRSETTNDIQVKFKTSAANGLLLLIHKLHTIEGDYLAMAVVDGAVEVSYNLGKQNADNMHIIRSGVRVDDGQWHTVRFERDLRKGVLTVDSNPGIEAVSLEGASQLDTDGTLWVGGSHSPPRGLPVQYFTGFEGCVESIVIEGENLDMSANRLSTNQLHFCEL